MDPGTLIQSALATVPGGLSEVAGLALAVGVSVLILTVGWKLTKHLAGF